MTFPSHELYPNIISQVFPDAAYVVTLVDRLAHRSKILAIDGDSYRFKEAQETAAAKAPLRAARNSEKITVIATKPNDLLLVCLPLDLCDDGTATLLQFLYDLTEARERHYIGEYILRMHRSPVPRTI